MLSRPIPRIPGIPTARTGAHQARERHDLKTVDLFEDECLVHRGDILMILWLEWLCCFLWVFDTDVYWLFMGYDEEYDRNMIGMHHVLWNVCCAPLVTMVIPQGNPKSHLVYHHVPS